MVSDCADGSYEKECGKLITFFLLVIMDNFNCEKSGLEAFMSHSCLPEHVWFSCLSKGTQKYMPISRACDDRTDEGGQCSKFQVLCYHYLAINTIMSAIRLQTAQTVGLRAVQMNGIKLMWFCLLLPQAISSIERLVLVSRVRIFFVLYF
jgi:hypothetical protein